MKSVLLDPNRFLWKHSLIYNLENEQALFFTLASQKIPLYPFFGIKWLSIILFYIYPQLIVLSVWSFQQARKVIIIILMLPLEMNSLANDIAKAQKFFKIQSSHSLPCITATLCLFPLEWLDLPDWLLHLSHTIVYLWSSIFFS